VKKRKKRGVRSQNSGVRIKKRIKNKRKEKDGFPTTRE